MKRKCKIMYGTASTRSTLFILCTIMLAQTVFAQASAVQSVISVSEGQHVTMDGHSILIKKANPSKDYCKVQVDNIKEENIKSGEAEEIGTFSIKVITVENRTCRLAVSSDSMPSQETAPTTPQQFDIVDTLNLPKMGTTSEQKGYQLNGRTFTLKVSSDSSREGNIFIFVPELREQEKTEPLQEGNSHTFSEGSTVTFIEMINDNQVKFGMKVDSHQDQPKAQSTASEESSSQQPAIPLSRDALAEKEIVSLETQASQEPVTIAPAKQNVASNKDDSCAPGLCYVDSDMDACFKPTSRMRLHDIPYYCDADGTIKKQKEANELAEYSYECKSNLLSLQGTCAALQQQVAPIKRIITWLYHVFG